MPKIIILLLYSNDTIFMVMIPYDLNKKLRIFMDFYSTTSMSANIDKMKVMIIKSQNIAYDTFIFMTTIDWREFLHTNTLESTFITSSIRTIVLIKG